MTEPGFPPAILVTLGHILTHSQGPSEGAITLLYLGPSFCQEILLHSQSGVPLLE